MVFITDFNEGDMISNVYLCKNKQAGTTKSGKTYYNLEGRGHHLTMSSSSTSRRSGSQTRESTLRLIICHVPRRI